ncbi:hypothetical protein [Clostridium lundense]|uniref:hypothetical protein n=1 Tax=Clostridium lundense TaxID=319475 RepID=UPI00048423FC|nr:hypothetical protein [Clostridium lundense]
MKTYSNGEVSCYKDMEEYKVDINNTINSMLSKNERLSFAIVAEKTNIDPLVIRMYPELRTYILEKIKYYKEMKVISDKIDKAVKSLLKSNKNLSFISIMNKCKFSLNVVYKNKYIKDKIISALTDNLKTP